MKSKVYIVAGVLALAQSVVASPEIKKMTVLGETIHIQGAEFDRPCRRCEVIANFDNLRYALQVISWADTDIKARLVDLGKRTKPTIEVVTPQWRSKPVRVQLNERLLPDRRIKWFVSGNSKNSESQYYSR